ncbi:MAG: Fur family transcriptional regulator [Anaerolineae bacterium]|jgi:Fur family ferric uptake transcriptional regulator
MACKEIFVQRLRKQGFRLTPQREIILSVLHDVEGWATADDIYGRVQDVSTSLDISTVYRTLDLLQELHLVFGMESGDGQRRYELLGVHGPHLHLVCQSCGQVIPADLDAAQAFGMDLQAKYGFQPALDQLSIPGLCPACAASDSRSEATSVRQEAQQR